jgi:hypothetical protein
MLTKANQGKYFTKEYREKFEKACIDRYQFSAEELAWLEIPDDMGYGKENPDTFIVQTQPADPFTRPRKIDYRTRFERGESEV